MAGTASSPHCGSHGGDPSPPGCRRGWVRASPFGSLRLLLHRKYPVQINLWPRYVAEGRKHGRGDFARCWFPKIAAMAWYRVRLWGSRQLPPVQGFFRMRCKSASSDAQSGESQFQWASFTPERGDAPTRPRSGDLQPDLADLAGCYSLLFHRPVTKKARICAAYVNPSLIFPCVSAKTATARARAASCVDTAGAGRSCCGALAHRQPTRDSHDRRQSRRDYRCRLGSPRYARAPEPRRLPRGRRGSTRRAR